MIQPDFKTFSSLAQQGNLVPVYETYTADLLTPVGAYLRIARDAKYSFLLESVEGGENIARYTFAGANPVEVFRARGRKCTVEAGKKETHFEASGNHAQGVAYAARALNVKSVIVMPNNARRLKSPHCRNDYARVETRLQNHEPQLT